MKSSAKGSLFDLASLSHVFPRLCWKAPHPLASVQLDSSLQKSEQAGQEQLLAQEPAVHFLLSRSDHSESWWILVLEPVPSDLETPPFQAELRAELVQVEFVGSLRLKSLLLVVCVLAGCSLMESRRLRVKVVEPCCESCNHLSCVAQGIVVMNDVGRMRGVTADDRGCLPRYAKLVVAFSTILRGFHVVGMRLRCTVHCSSTAHLQWQRSEKVGDQT